MVWSWVRDRGENFSSYTEYGEHVSEALVHYPAQATLTFKSSFVAVNEFMRPLTRSFASLIFEKNSKVKFLIFFSWVVSFVVGSLWDRCGSFRVLVTTPVPLSGSGTRHEPLRTSA